VAKQVTREQAERKKQQAAAFTERIGEPDRASEFDEMSVEEYAEHRGLQIANPRRKAGKRALGGSTRTVEVATLTATRKTPMAGTSCGLAGGAMFFAPMP
jgi:hypothetical protein